MDIWTPVKCTQCHWHMSILYNFVSTKRLNILRFTLSNKKSLHLEKCYNCDIFISTKKKILTIRWQSLNEKTFLLNTHNIIVVYQFVLKDVKVLFQGNKWCFQLWLLQNDFPYQNGYQYIFIFQCFLLTASMPHLHIYMTLQILFCLLVSFF